MRLPVVARAWREQRIEGLLPRRVRRRPDVLAETRTEAAQPLDVPFALRQIAVMEDREHDDLAAVHVGRQERQRRRLAQHHPGVERPPARWRRTRDTARESPGSASNGKTSKPGQHLRSRRGAARIRTAVTTPKLPPPPRIAQNRFGIVVGAGASRCAVGGDDVGRHEIVDGHAVLARQPAEAAAERQTGDAGGRVDADRRRQAVGLRRPVDDRRSVAPGST